MVERKCGARGEFVEGNCLDASGMAPQEAGGPGWCAQWLVLSHESRDHGLCFYFNIFY